MFLRQDGFPMQDPPDATGGDGGEHSPSPPGGEEEALLNSGSPGEEAQGEGDQEEQLGEEGEGDHEEQSLLPAWASGSA